MSENPTWPKVINAVGSTTSEFGALDWANLISDYFNGVNIGLTNPDKVPIIGTLTKYKPDKLALYDADQSHHLVLSADDIDTGDSRKVRFRRMNSPFTEDFAVLEGMPQTLINKTLDSDLNTIINIVNTDIKSNAAIDYSKLNLSNGIINADVNTSAAIVTTKLADSTNFVLTTRTNSFGDFNNTFKDNRLLINNPADTFAYTIIAAAITANRSITLPLLTANDTLVTAAFSQALTNKTIDADSNTIINIENADIKSSAAIDYSKLNLTGSILNADINASAGIVTTKLADSANFVLTTRTNTFGDFNQIFRDNRLLINNPGDTFAYTIIGAAITGNRNLTLPLLTGNDTVVTEAFSQALTNKTINADSNTITNIEDADIKAAAGIAYSKLTLTGSILNADINASAAIATTKLADSANFILKTLDNSFGAHYQDFTKMTVPGNPGANDIRMYVDTADTHLKIKNNAGTVVDLHLGGGGGGGATNLDGLTDVDLTTTTPVNGDVLTYTTTGTKWVPAAPPGGGGTVTASSVTTFTNKTIDADAAGNSITNIENADIKAAAGIVTTKLADSAAFVLTTRTNTFGAFDQIFPTSRLLIGDSDASHSYIIAGSNLAANRTVTLPLLTANDVFVTAAFSQTLTNKTLTSPVISTISNSGTITIPTGTDTLVGKATTDTFTNKTFNADGTGNSITNIEDADIKAAAAIATSKLADSANFLLKTLDNNFGAHYFDMTRMTAPANPAVNDGRVYTKQIDTNNDGVFCKIKKAGAFVEVQIA